MAKSGGATCRPRRIWTLNIELTPIYALQPVGAFSADIYENLLQMLDGEVQAEDTEDDIDRVSISGRVTDKTVKLFSGQTVPVLKLYSPCGMYGWTVNTLVDSAIDAVSGEVADAQEQANS